MANYSEAFGNIEIRGPEEAITVILNLFKMTEAWDSEIKINPNSIENYADDNCTADFTGVGRHCFQENIANLFHWLEKRELISEEEKILLENSDFKIIFDFTDYEPGSEIFCQAVDILEHKKNTPLSEIEYIPCEYTSLSLDWSTRLDYKVESKDALASMLNDMDGGKMMEFLEEESKGLEKHFGCSLLEVLDHLSLMLPNNRSLKAKYLEQQLKKLKTKTTRTTTTREITITTLKM